MQSWKVGALTENQELINFLQTWKGKLCLALFYYLTYVSFGINVHLSSLSIILFFLVFTNFANEIKVLFVSIALYIGWPFYDPFQVIGTNLGNNEYIMSKFNEAIKVLPYDSHYLKYALFIFLILFYLSLFFSHTKRIDNKKRLSLWFCLILTLTLIFTSTSYTSVRVIVFLALITIILRTILSFWFLKVLENDFNKISLPKFLAYNLQSFFLLTSSTTPYPIIQSLNQLKKADSAEEAVIRLKGLKLLIWARLVHLVSEFLMYAIFGKTSAVVPFESILSTLHLSSPLLIGYREYLALDLPLYKHWLSLMGLTFLSLLETTAAWGLIISLFRITGIYLPRGVYRPLQARSLSEFYGRSLHYYANFLMNAGFYPLYKKLTLFNTFPKLKKYLTLFIVFGIMNYCFHLLFLVNYIYYYDPKTIIDFFFVSFPLYFILLGICLCLSETHFFNFLPRFLNAPIFLLIMALVLATFTYSPKDTLIHKIEYLKVLVGLS